MSAACGPPAPPLDGREAGYRRVLWTVLGLNLLGLVVEAGAGVFSGSLALQADALDFLGDAANYGIALFVLARSIQWRASAALAKGLAMGMFGLWVLAAALYKSFIVGAPSAAVMGWAATAALAANVICALLLYRYREGDSNMRSVWLCSRNDALGNIAVLAAAGMVAVSASRWPDLAVAVLIAGLALSASLQVVRQARAELRTARLAPMAAE